MRVIFILWLIPLVLFWGWYGLSAYDINFGYFFLSRVFHDHLFEIYGGILNMPAENVPIALAWIFAIDTVMVFFGVAAIRWYKLWLPPMYGKLKRVFTGKPQPKMLEERVEAVLARKETVKSDLVGPAHPAE